jgi:hypothetical protein
MAVVVQHCGNCSKELYGYCRYSAPSSSGSCAASITAQSIALLKAILSDLPNSRSKGLAVIWRSWESEGKPSQALLTGSSIVLQMLNRGVKQSIRCSTYTLPRIFIQCAGV